MPQSRPAGPDGPSIVWYNSLRWEVEATVSDEAIHQAAEILAKAAPPARIVMFGSYARGDAHEESDVDFLVIEPHVRSRRAEMVRLRAALRPLRIPVDILVVTDELVHEIAHIPGTTLHAALSEGKVLREPE